MAVAGALPLQRGRAGVAFELGCKMAGRVEAACQSDFQHAYADPADITVCPEQALGLVHTLTQNVLVRRRADVIAEYTTEMKLAHADESGQILQCERFVQVFVNKTLDLFFCKT